MYVHTRLQDIHVHVCMCIAPDYAEVAMPDVVAEMCGQMHFHNVRLWNPDQQSLATNMHRCDGPFP